MAFFGCRKPLISNREAGSGKKIERLLSQKIMATIQSILAKSSVKAAALPIRNFLLGLSLLTVTLLSRLK